MTVKEVNDAVRREVERIYQESWLQGVSVPIFDEKGNTYLANPDGIMRTAQPGQGRYAYHAK